MAEQKIRRRLPRKEREKLIVEEAVRFFAEVGFEGQTRALAQRLGVTQPLLYRYFPDKESLIERVYQEVFIGGWDPDWAKLLTDRSRPLVDRIIDFYAAYGRANVSYERVRLFLFAGLKEPALANRYLAFIRDNLFVPLAIEIRAEAGLPSADPSAAEIECVAGLHGAVGYIGTRRWVFQAPVPEDTEAIQVEIITSFLLGAPAAFRTLAKASVAE
ncbi:MAG: TetR/AcrR family transcriptional regulator [Pseudomonadota bacterium]